jgi:hypothetical protein
MGFFIFRDTDSYLNCYCDDNSSGDFSNSFEQLAATDKHFQLTVFFIDFDECDVSFFLRGDTLKHHILSTHISCTLRVPKICNRIVDNRSICDHVWNRCVLPSFRGRERWPPITL